MHDKPINKLNENIILESILRSSTDMAIAATDLDFRILYYNPVAEKIFGYTAEEVIGKTVMEIHTKEKVEPSRFEKAIETVIKEGEYRYTVEQKKEDGIRFIDSRVSGIWNKGNNLIGFVLMSRDITECKQAEEELKESEEKYRKLFNNEIDAVCIFDIETRKILDVNDAYLKLYGYTRDEILQLTTDDISAEPEETRKAIRKSAETGDILVPLRNHRKKDGTVFQIEISAGSFKWKGRNVMFAIAKDITERIRAEDALVESENKYRTLVDNALVGIYKTNLKGEILYVNEASASMFDFDSPGKMIQGNVLDRYKNPRDREVLIKNLKRKGRIRNFETEVLTRKKKTKTVLLSAALEGDAISGMIMDITERKKTEIELETLRGELEEKVKKRTSELKFTIDLLQKEITERESMENKLRDAEKKLIVHAQELLESNAALKVLLKQREEDQRDIEHNIISNVKHLVLPYLTKLKRNRPVSEELTYLNILESNLKEIISPFSEKLSSRYLNFTPKEIQIADLIKDGKQDKDIMEILNISLDTVKTHRKNIRRKLGIYGNRMNLRSKLLSIFD